MWDISQGEILKTLFTGRPSNYTPYSGVVGITALCICVAMIPAPGLTQTSGVAYDNLAVHYVSTVPSALSVSTLSDVSSELLTAKEDRCLKASRWIGAISGSAMGCMQIYWSATGMSGIHGSFGENLLTGIPSILAGGYVGARITEWATRKIMEENPKPGKAALKGLVYGAIDGTITLAAGVVPLAIIRHYTGTIEFNRIREPVIPWLVGTATLGGVLYGGTIGAVAGAVIGPGISLYMGF